MWTTFLKIFITVISRFDGKPGLSLGDFKALVEVATTIDLDKGLTGEQKEAMLRQVIVVRYAHHLTRWLVGFVSNSVYVYARNNGLLDRPTTGTGTVGDNVLLAVPHELRGL